MEKVRWRIILRDVAIVWVLVSLGSFVVGFVGVGVDEVQEQWGYVVSFILFGTTGFFIVGCMTKTDRFKHLFIVAVAIWLIGAVEQILFSEFTVAQWLLGIIWILIVLVVGGGLSFIFVRTPQQLQGYNPMEVRRIVPLDNIVEKFVGGFISVALGLFIFLGVTLHAPQSDIKQPDFTVLIIAAILIAIGGIALLVFGSLDVKKNKKPHRHQYRWQVSR